MQAVRFYLICWMFLLACQATPDGDQINWDGPAINGNPAYLASPFVTPGDRTYLIGHQNGAFPDLGWHITGEMGGLWNHPIKLADGFDITLIQDQEELTLNRADSFINYPYGNVHKFSWAEKQLKIQRTQFVPDQTEGIVVQLILQNRGHEPQDLQITFTAHSDLRPTWLGERTGMVDSRDSASYLAKEHSWHVWDEQNPWHLQVGSTFEPVAFHQSNSSRPGKGKSVTLQYDVTIAPGEDLMHPFILAGSYRSDSELHTTFLHMRSQWPKLLASKQNRYQDIARFSKLTIPDERLAATFEWLKYNCDWLIQSVPEIGTGMMAGLPDYPWWFGCDSEYALQGYMAVGQFEVVHHTIALLDSISTAVNGNGRIVHEVSTNGAVFNPGNINETPQFASLIWNIYLWNGDKEFLEKYFPSIEKGLDWLLAENDSDGDLLPEGYGMMEIHGLDSEMIDVASYTQKAFADASRVAAELGKRDLVSKYQSIADSLQEKINHQFWSEEFDSYADFLGTDDQAIHLIDAAIVRADTLDKPWAVSELKETKQKILNNPSSETRPFVVHHNWIVNTPMEVGLATPDKAVKALQTASRFVNPFGVFVSGIDRDASAGSDDGSFQGSQTFSYVGAVMTLPTGVQAVAENNYGNPDAALNYLQRMTRSFSFALPGSMYEVSPDYGMCAQAWNIYAFAVPIVRQFFGIAPFAAQREIIITPQMPQAWDEASLENVRIGDNEISIYYQNLEEGIHLRVVQRKSDWNVKVKVSSDATAKIIKGELFKVGEVRYVKNSGTELAFQLLP